MLLPPRCSSACLCCVYHKTRHFNIHIYIPIMYILAQSGPLPSRTCLHIQMWVINADSKKKISKCIIPPSILYEAQNQARKLQHLIDKTNEGRLHLCRLHHALNCSASFSLHFIPLQHMEQRPIRCPFCVDSDDTHPGRCTIWCCHGGRKSAR